MKIEVYEANPPIEDVTWLRLITDGGTVKLVAVDADGGTVPGGYLLGFDTNKRGFYLCTSVGPDLGFPLTAKGQLKVATW